MAKQIRPSIDAGRFNKSAIVLYRLEMRPYNFKEICQLYGMNSHAMRSLMKPVRKKLGKVHGYYFSVIQLEKIIQHLGPPYVIQETINPSGLGVDR